MAKGAYIGVGGKARKVKNLYIGVDGKARKVKKAYIGVNGKAQPFYSSSAYGETWTVYNTMPATSVEYQVIALAYGNGMFVGVCGGNEWETNRMVYSPDGINWTRDNNMPSTESWMDVIYADGKFVAISYGVNVGAYSTDGINWTEMRLSRGASWSKIAYGNGRFIAISAAGTYRAYTTYSTDGINWENGGRISSNSSYLWESIAFGNGIFMAVSGNRNNELFNCAISTDGLQWSLIYSDSFCAEDLAYGNGVFVAVGWIENESDYDIMYSQDNGNTWTGLRLSNTSSGERGFKAIVYTGERFVAIPILARENTAYSDDGINWVRGGDIVVQGSPNWTDVVYGDGKVIASTDDVYFAVTE